MSQVALAPDAPAPASSAGSRVNRSALAAAIAVGHAIGILPVCFLIDAPRTALIATAVVAAFTLLIAFMRPPTTMSTAQPQPRHFVMATASAAFHGVVSGFMWLGLYWVFVGLIWLSRAIVGWPAVPDALIASVTPSMIAASPFVVAALAAGYREVRDQLYPDRAGVETLYETAIQSREAWMLTAVVLGIGVVFIAAAALQYRMPWLLSLVLLIVSMTLSSPLATLSSSTEKRPVLREVTDATRRLLVNAGYDVLQAPRTGDASVDPLLADLSLYVRAPGRGRAFAIDIKASPTNQPLDWSAASSLKLKVSALTSIESRDEDTETIESITPLFVALSPIDESLREFASDHQVMLFELAPATATESIGKGLPDETAKPGVAATQASAAPNNAALRAAAQNVPEMIRAFIAEHTPEAARTGAPA